MQPGGSLLQRLRGDTRGQGLVEFALAVPVVLILLLGTIELGHFFYTRITVRHAVAEAARFAVTGRTTTDEDGNSRTRAESIQATVTQWAGQTGLDVESIDIQPPDGGNPGEVVRVAVDFQYRFILPLVQDLLGAEAIDFTVATAMRNEPRF